MKPEFSKIFINNSWRETEKSNEVRNPFDDSIVGISGLANAEQMQNALNSAEIAFEKMRNLPVHKIADGLSKMRNYLEEIAEEIAQDLSKEAGKPITLARGEVARCLHTFEDGIEECKRIYGETIPLDRREWGENRTAIVERFTLGIVGAITPFNFPLNLAAHKIVPALAAKNTVILKPARQTPFSALHLAKSYENSGLPKGGLNVLPCGYDSAELLLTDERVKKISFTGSAKVGWEIKKRANKKKVSLELGGNAAVVVCADADLEKTTQSVANGGFLYAGQSCISAQRIFVDSALYDEFSALLRAKTKLLIFGNPADEKTQIGPLVNKNEADRVMDWIDEATANGAQILTGGKRDGNVILPTILTDAKSEMSVICREIFGPVLTLTQFEDFENALDLVNDSKYGLQAGVFTNDVNRIRKSFQKLEVGGVIINDVPTWRIDHMPYGGVKNSGVGREGVRYAIEEMTERKLLVIAF